MQLRFQFDSLAELMDMAGHGSYVWACYAITFAVMIYLVIDTRLAESRIKVKIKQLMRRKEKSSAKEVRSAK